MVVARVLAAVREISDPRKQVKEGAKVARQLINEIYNVTNNPHQHIKELREEIQQLNTKLLDADRVAHRHVSQTVTLLKANRMKYGRAKRIIVTVHKKCGT